MTLEYVLLLFLSTIILAGLFHKDLGPIGVFHNSAPRLAAKLERDISVGKQFRKEGTGESIIKWLDPQ
ncbi:MAG: hypothetical protein A2Z20_05485 [Bdellovibrionales bacterium RBG_16_40_8]|nr:MAG: hypothetical protein A2Z20_05485 [Bdellovibrionales bacterium RBG_16_40_8]